jgi:phosphatidylglycerophosphate synthase
LIKTEQGVLLLKYIANLISICRIISTLLLWVVLTLHNTGLFLVLYFIGGLSDVLDGYIARKTNTQSELGARLDSIADLIFFAAVTVFIILWMGKAILTFLPLLLITVLIRSANLIIAAYKYHSFSVLHTWGNKIIGFLLFITPLFIIYDLSVLIWAVCIISVLAAMEECIIHLTSPELNLNRRSIFKR